VTVSVRTVVYGERNSVEFTEKNVRADPDAIEELVEMNSQSTPGTIIDGDIIIGFDRQRISEKLGLWPFGAILL
jgi:glutaredoxin 3